MIKASLPPSVQPHTVTRLHADVSRYENEAGLAFLAIENQLASATLALQGAHLMYWQPHNATHPLLWLSDNARYVSGRSVRGGIPICWPWFGVHPTDSSYCMHGFARIIPWQLQDIQALSNGTTRLLLEMQHTTTTRQQLSYDYRLELAITLGDFLRLELMTTNLAEHPFMIGEAFHTYFQISDVSQVSIQGLENVMFADKVIGYQRDIQHGRIDFNGEFDRIYYSHHDCLLHDRGYGRSIRINKSASNNTVIWTPWQEKAQQISDMGKANDWRNMLCVESANAMEHNVIIYPAETHSMAVEYNIELSV